MFLVFTLCIRNLEVASNKWESTNTTNSGEYFSTKPSFGQSAGVADSTNTSTIYLSLQSDLRKENAKKKRLSLLAPFEVKSGRHISIPLKNDPNTFAACLLIMDDNHFLIEWIAYHYHVMPLRRLIILQDIKSITSPAPVLERWKNRMNITQWFEKDIYPHGNPNTKRNGKNKTLFGMYVTRQRDFVRQCLQTFHREGRGWVLLTDTDEYTMINENIQNPKHKPTPASNIFGNTTLPIPSQKEPGSVIKFLRNRDIIIPHTGQHLWDNPCITMSRKVIKKKAEFLSSQAPSYISSGQFCIDIWNQGI